jgi:flagellar motor switch/type III secretory pathway protein FliN
MSTPETQVAAADFAELPRGAGGGAGQLNLDLIMDVRLVLTLEVGRRARWSSSTSLQASRSTCS